MRSAAILVLGFCATAHGQAPELKWRFAKGDVFHLERVARNEFAFTLSGRVTTQAAENRTLFRVEVIEADADRAKLRIGFREVQAKQLAGKTAVDNKILERLAGGALVVDVTPLGRVEAIAGHADLLERLSQKKAATEPLLREAYPESLFRQEIEDLFAVLPEKPLAVGASWTRPRTVAIPIFGTIAGPQTTLYQENDRAGHAVFVGEWNGTYQKPASPSPALRVVGGEGKIEKGTWEATFDLVRGRVLRASRSWELRARLTIDALGADGPTDLVAKSKASTRLVPD